MYSHSVQYMVLYLYNLLLGYMRIHNKYVYTQCSHSVGESVTVQFGLISCVGVSGPR
jgi:hypothetical protein